MGSWPRFTYYYIITKLFRLFNKQYKTQLTCFKIYQLLTTPIYKGNKIYTRTPQNKPGAKTSNINNRKFLREDTTIMNTFLSLLRHQYLLKT